MAISQKKEIIDKSAKKKKKKTLSRKYSRNELVDTIKRRCTLLCSKANRLCLRLSTIKMSLQTASWDTWRNRLMLKPSTVHKTLSLLDSKVILSECQQISDVRALTALWKWLTFRIHPFLEVKNQLQVKLVIEINRKRKQRFQWSKICLNVHWV